VNEADRIAMLARIFSVGADASGSGSGIATGIGDDAAVLEIADGRTDRGQLAWTIDEQVDGTHFRRDLASWRDIGWRSFMAAASDLAAMGAAPWCALAALVLSGDVDDAALESIVRGQRAAADAVGVRIVGGNLARGPALSIATTLLGTCERAILRSGARPGDGVWMAGQVGLAAAGLRALEAGRGAEPALRAAVEAWRTPAALVAHGRAMRPVAHAAIDVSDGLARDAGHVAEASGVRVVLDEGLLLADAALSTVAVALGADPLDLALHGGEDYALVVASAVPVEGFRRIGDVTEGRGIALRGPSGERSIEPRGFDHFTSGKPTAASRS
jgi:thiamine-monophosphate kinase